MSTKKKKKMEEKEGCTSYNGETDRTATADSGCWGAAPAGKQEHRKYANISYERRSKGAHLCVHIDIKI